MNFVVLDSSAIGLLQDLRFCERLDVEHKVNLLLEFLSIGDFDLGVFKFSKRRLSFGRALRKRFTDLSFFLFLIPISWR